MKISQKVHCPNCGKLANRYYHLHNQSTETACPACDYLLKSCSLTGQVFESYAPGLRMNYC
jgi:hypothetical protein